MPSSLLELAFRACLAAPGAMVLAAEGETAARTSLADSLSPWYALALGSFGSLAYLVAVWTGFVGRNTEARDRILEHFREHRLLALFYVLSGAGVAMVFQFPETKLVPVQAFILGCTWPAVVSNYISGRQVGEQPPIEKTRELQQEATETGEAKATAAELKQRLEESAKLVEERKAEFGKLFQELLKPGTVPPPPPAPPPENP